MRNALAHAGESSRRVVSAFMATAFAQDGAEAAESARHRLPSGAVAGDRAPPGDGRPRILPSAMVLFRGRFRGVHRASADAGHSPTAKGSAGDLVGSTMDVEEMVILRVSSRVEYEPSPLLALPAADEGPRGIGEPHRCVRRETAWTASSDAMTRAAALGSGFGRIWRSPTHDGAARPPRFRRRTIRETLLLSARTRKLMTLRNYRPRPVVSCGARVHFSSEQRQDGDSILGRLASPRKARRGK
jgi:hypothetical protein